MIWLIITSPLLSFGFEYHIQKKDLNPAQLRASLTLSKELKITQFVEVNRTPQKLLKGLSIHQIYASYTGYKTVGVVFLENEKNLNYPEKMNLGQATLYHFKIKKSVMAVWTKGLSEIEKNRIYAVLKNQTISENQSVWSRLIPQAYAQTCEQKSQDVMNPIVGKMNESGYSHCWDKLGEGVESYAEGVAEDVKKKVTLDYDLFAYWEQVKQVAGGIADFATKFFSNPIAWIQQNVPNASDIDLSGLANIDKHEMLGLACLSLGHEGLSTLVSSVIRGPAGLGIKIFQMISKISAVAKIMSLLKKFANLTADTFKMLKDKLVKLAEKVIKGEQSSDKTDSISGLMKMSPALAQEGLACIGI